MNYADDIKNAVPMTEAAEYYGFEANRAGFICCPFHGEKTPSCKIYDGTRGWHCYGCGRGGSVIDFVEGYFGLNYNDAVAKINEDFRLGLPIGVKLGRRKQLHAGQEAFRRRQAQEKHKQELKALDDAYWRAFDIWKKYDDNKRKYQPSTPEEEINPLYVEAVKNIDLAAFKAEQAEEERNEYVRQYNRTRTELYKRRISEYKQAL